MSLSLQTLPSPIRADQDGVLRVGDSRVLLDLVIHAFQDGATAETIVQEYPSISLADVYATIAYYLRHRQEVDAYLSEREQQSDLIRRELEEQQRDMSDLRARLTARRTS